MPSLQDLSDDEIMSMVESFGPSQPKGLQSLSDDEIMSMVSQYGPPSPAGDTPELQSQGVSEWKGVMPYIAALLSGGKRGLGELGYGSAGMVAQGVDKLAGTNLQGQVPKYKLSGIDKSIAQEHPGTAEVGDIAAKTLPLMFAPELGAGLRGEMAGQALVGGVEGAVETPEDRMKGFLTGGTVAAVAPLAGKVVGSAVGAARRGAGKALTMGGTNSKEEVLSAMGAAKRMNVKIPIAETIDSPMLKSTQSSFLSSLPFSGMSKEYLKIGKGLDSQIEGLLKDIKPKTEQSVGKTLQEALIGAKSSAEAEKTKLYGKVHDIASGLEQKVSPESYRRNAAAHLEDITKYAEDNEEFNDIFDHSVYSILSKASKKGDITYDAAFDLDKRINNALSKADGNQDYPTSSILRSLKGSITEDIDRSAENSGNKELTSAWKEAKSHFQSEVAPLRERDVSKLTKREADLDTIIPNFLKTGAYERPQLLGRLTKHLSDEEKGNVGHQFLTKGLREDGDDLKLNSDKVLNAYNKLGNKQRDLLFSKDQKQKLDDAWKLRSLMGMDLKQMISPKTGEKVSKALGLTAALAALASGGPLAAGGLLAGGLGAKEVVMSDMLKSLYQKSLQRSKMASPELKRAAIMAGPISRNNRNK